MIGKSVSHYRILESLGRGGMGLVYKAEDTRLARPVALKFIAEDLSMDPTAVGRFEREAQTASALNHPNICTIYDIGEFEGQPFIAMEFLQGKTLKDLLRDGPITVDAMLEYSIQLASALSAAHTAAILHRDIKPANIFVTRQDQAKLLDFGLAKLLRDEKKANQLSEQPTIANSRDDLTQPGSAIGTVAYMSPEQARGEELDARSDLFSLGAVLYEMATGRPAFAGETMAVIFDAILNRTPVPASQLNPALPPRLDEILVRLLEKDSRLRYSSATDLEADLRRLRREKDSIQSGVTLPPTRRRNRAMVAVATVLSAGAVIVLTLLFVSHRAPVLSDRDIIVLADFVNETGDTVFDGTLKEALAIQLEQSTRLNILPDDRIRETLRLMARSPDEKVTDKVAREICQREGLKAVLG